jgi:hypothetical protein
VLLGFCLLSQELLAESSKTVTSLQTFIVLRCSKFYKEVTITGDSELENHPSQNSIHNSFSFNFITLLNYSACTNSNLSHEFFHTGTTGKTIQIKGATIKKFN